MAINFDSLPDGSGYAMPTPGFKYATIEKASMEKAKTSGNMYLSVVMVLTDPETGKKVGKLFERIQESSADALRYKLKRFLIATELKLTTFELKDLVKLVPGKKLIVDVTIDETGNRPQVVSNLFHKEIFYPMSDAAKLFGEGVATTEPPVDNDTINAPDAEDIPFPDDNNAPTEY